MYKTEERRILERDTVKLLESVRGMSDNEAYWMVNDMSFDDLEALLYELEEERIGV